MSASSAKIKYTFFVQSRTSTFACVCAYVVTSRVSRSMAIGRKHYYGNINVLLERMTVDEIMVS